jgi:hypothetical protein
MAFTYYFYSNHSVDGLKTVLEKTESAFEELLISFEDQPYVKENEKLISLLANVIPGPILADLTFEDFAVEEGRIKEMQNIFSNSKSCLVLENVPYLQTNPFQVSWLNILLDHIGSCMIDTGSITPVKNKEDFVEFLKKSRSLDQVLNIIYQPQIIKSTKSNFIPVEPLDFIVRDVFKEFERLQNEKLLDKIEKSIESNEKMKKLFLVIKNNFSDGPVSAQLLCHKSHLNPKDFGDFLESLKFLMKRT